jgi:hypothetical protein
MSTRAGLRRRLELLRAAVEPKGTYIRISDPFPEGEASAPVVVGQINGCTVWGSSSSRSILDRELPDGFTRSPDGVVIASGSGHITRSCLIRL